MRGEENEQNHSSTSAPGWLAYRQARMRTKAAAPGVDDPADLEKPWKEAWEIHKYELLIPGRQVTGPASDSILVVIYTKNWWDEITLELAISGTPSDPESSLPRSKTT